ncbi:MAG: sigma-70 family RNA polymerase sigma factor [Bacteroidetes bacterium]|nr:sigma-70 family RNA polymerase sigma factor [Bacteroidota bacterium]
MLYEFFCRKMFPICLRYSQNQQEAEDTMQEGFLKVFENLRNFKNEGSLEGWIKKIMVNTAIQKFRKNSNRLNDVSLDSADWNQSFDENATSDLGTKELMALIQKLPPKCRLVFNLFVLDGYNHRQIAEQLGISEGTSKSNLHDARMMLQKVLNKLNALELVQR